MSQITEPSTAEIVRRYVDVWSEPDSERRYAAIAGLWAPNGAEFVEGVQFRGPRELDARIAHAYQEFVADLKAAKAAAAKER